VIIAPVATGHRSTVAAFVTTKTSSLRSTTSTKLTTTRLFFDNTKRNLQQQHEEQYTFTDSTGTVSKGIPSTGTKRSNDSPTELSASSSASVLNSCANTNGENSNRLRKQSYKIYCDMDGCLVNFEKGVRMLLKTGSSDLDKRKMWEGISRAPLWFETLEWQMDGRRLWSAIKHLNPDILTGVPDIESSRIEKFNWCKRELGLEDTDAHHVDMAADGLNEDHKSVNGNLPREDKTNIITCWSNNKYKECNRRGSILIDDRIDLKKNWEHAGGIFIHHINTEKTIRKLRDLGVISEGGLDNGENDWYLEGSWRLWTAE